MSDNRQDHKKAPREAMRRFLHSQAIGCHFAAGIVVPEDGAIWQVVSGAIPPERVITDLFTAAEKQRRFAAAVLPLVTSARSLRSVLNALGSQERWQLEVRREGATEIASLFWITSDGERSNVMGMAPMLSMPPTRRAPYVALFAWPAARGNRFRKKPRPDIGIGDTPPSESLDEAGYADMFKKTRTGSLRLNGPKELPLNTTFLLSPDKACALARIVRELRHTRSS